MDLGLAGKTVLVTAASRGLGYATAHRFAAEGAQVMLASRQASALMSAVATIRQETGNSQVESAVADVADAADIESLFAATERAFGPVDVLINNAGGPPPGNFDAVTDDQWLKAYQLTLQSVVRCTRRALPHMRKQHFGRIVNFASSSVRQPIDNLILSNTFRAGIVGLSKSLALELATDGILVNTLGPGRIATARVAELDAARAASTGMSPDSVRQQWERQIPTGRYGEPDEFAVTAVFLGSGLNTYVTGQTVLVDGGLVRAL